MCSLSQLLSFLEAGHHHEMVEGVLVGGHEVLAAGLSTGYVGDFSFSHFESRYYLILRLTDYFFSLVKLPLGQCSFLDCGHVIFF
jgi:hypothetical protein